MSISSNNLPSGKGTPARWALLVLVFGLLITYPVLDYAVISHVRNNFTLRQYNHQSVAASAVRSVVALGIEHGNSPQSAFNSVFVTSGLGQTPGVSTALIAPDGALTAFAEGFELSGTDNLSSFIVVDWPTGIEMGFMDFVSGASRNGKLKRPTGADTGQMICSAKLPGLEWYIISLQGTSEIEENTATTRLYLIVAFLVLAVFLVLLILSFYFTLAADLSSAINSAKALEDASIRFQEKAGELRRPLHNIQGLADMLAITDDPDERDNYLREIKDEVKLIIDDLEKTAG